MLSPHESCCNFLIEESTKKLLNFLYKDVLVSFHKNETVSKLEEYLELLCQYILTSAVPKEIELNQKNYSCL